MAKARPRSGWHPEEIKAAIRKTGWSLDGISRACELPAHCVRHALRHPNLPGEIVILALLRIDPWKIWPDRYAADGTRLCRALSSQSPNLSVLAGHCEKRAAA